MTSEMKPFFGPMTSEIIGPVSRISWTSDIRYRQLIQAESDVRWNNRYSRLLKNANFRYTSSLEQIDTGGHRGIDPGMLSTLAVGNYIKNGESILITGATGVGKSMLATALGHQACRQGYSVMYYNTQKLLPALKVARLEGGTDQKAGKAGKSGSAHPR